MLEAILGVLGTVAAAIIGGVVALRTRGPRFEKPELVDVAFSRTTGQETPATGDVAVSRLTDRLNQCVLDVKLRNPGEQPIFVVRATLEITDTRTLPEWPVPDPGHYGTATEVVSAVSTASRFGLASTPGNGPSRPAWTSMRSTDWCSASATAKRRTI